MLSAFKRHKDCQRTFTCPTPLRQVNSFMAWEPCAKTGEAEKQNLKKINGLEK